VVRNSDKEVRTTQASDMGSGAVMAKMVMERWGFRCYRGGRSRWSGLRAPTEVGARRRSTLMCVWEEKVGRNMAQRQQMEKEAEEERRSMAQWQVMAMGGKVAAE